MFQADLTFETTFTKEISSIFIDFLSLEELFYKFNLLNKNFHNIVEALKSYPKVWKNKYIQEFMSNEDRKRRKYGTPEAQEKFLTLFRDNAYDPNGVISMYEFLKQSILKQLRIREKTRGVIEETNRHMIENN